MESTFCLMRMALASSIFVLIFSFRYSSYANGWATALACTLKGREEGEGGGGRSEVERGEKGEGEVRQREEERKGRGEEGLRELHL